MVLRNLADRRVGGRDDLDHLGNRDVGDLGSAKRPRHVDSPKAALGELVQFLKRQAALAIADRRLSGETLGQAMCDPDRLAVIADYVGRLVWLAWSK